MDKILSYINLTILIEYCRYNCNDLFFLNQTLHQINVALTQIIEGKIIKLLLIDFREVYSKRAYN